MLLSTVENRVEDLKILLQHVQWDKRHIGYCLRVRVGEANSTMPTVVVTPTGEQYSRFWLPRAPCPVTSVTARRLGGINVSMKVRNDPLVNSYNPSLLQLWRANTDVSAVLLTDVAKYIGKYVSKEETYGDFVHWLPNMSCRILLRRATLPLNFWLKLLVIATSVLRNSARLFLGRHCIQCHILSHCSLYPARLAFNSA